MVDKMNNLTEQQRSELIDRFVELQVDSMDHESLEQFVTETLRREFDPLSNSELQDEIRYSFDEETLDELIDNVSSETTEVI